MARLTMLLMAVLATAALVAGCGDDESEGSAGESADITVEASDLSKGAFTAKANAICLRAARTILSYDDEAASEKEGFEQRLEASILPPLQNILDGIQELGAPEGDQEVIEAYLVALQGAITELEEEKKSVGSFDAVEKALARPGFLASGYGIGTCNFS